MIKYIRAHAREQGYKCFDKIGKGVLYKILSQSDIKLHICETKPAVLNLSLLQSMAAWLNLIENFFSKIACSLLRHIRVQSKEELVERIYQGIEEINREPVIFHWRYKMDEITLA